MEKFRR